LCEFCEALAKSRGVELIDGECADAARSAAWAADQEVTASAGSVGESRVEDLDEFVVANGARVGGRIQVFRVQKQDEFTI